MTLEEVLNYLEQNGDPRALKSWGNMGIVTKDKYFGNGLTKLKAFAKKVKRNHELALQLWGSGIHDAKLLACFIEEPKKVTEEQVEQQLNEVYFFDVGDRWVMEVVSKTPFAQNKMELWTQAEEEYTKRCGFCLVTILAATQKDLPNSYWMPYVQQIENELQSERNWVKEMMNYALMAIGKRNEEMNAIALATTNKIGVVEVDYGNTSCKTIDAKAALKKMKF